MSDTPSFPPAVHSALAALARAELTGVNPHTLEVALLRVNEEGLDFGDTEERFVAIALLERAAYPVTLAELSAFLSVKHTLGLTDLVESALTNEHAQHYIRWVAAFLNDPDPNIQSNVRILLRWLVANRRDAINAQQESLDNLRQIADDPETGWRNSAFLVYTLGSCGTPDDNARILHHAEMVIEHERENLDLVAEGLYYHHPPALINALQFFLDHTHADDKKQFMTGLHLLAKVAEIDDREFWQTYYDELADLVDRLDAQGGSRQNRIERILDQIEKQLAWAAVDE